MLDNKKVIRYLFIVVLLILAYLAYLLIAPFFGSIIIGLLVGYLFLPLNNKLKRLVKNKNLSALLITILIVIVFIVCLSFLINLILTESLSFYNSINIDKISGLIDQYLHSTKTEQFVTSLLENGLNYIIGVIYSLIIKIPGIIVGALVSIVVTFFTLRDSDKLYKKINLLLPFSANNKVLVIKKFKETMDAVIYSTIVISLIETVVVTFGYYIFGVKAPIFWGFVTLIVALLPFLGPATVWLPLGVYLTIMGNKFNGIGLILYGIILISIIFEGLLKQWLIAKKGKMHPLIVLIGVLGGLILFGVPGLILGPFLLSIFIFSLEVFIEGKSDIVIKNEA